MLNVNDPQFNYANLTTFTWKGEVLAYQTVPDGNAPFRTRIEFNSVVFQGKSGQFPVGAMVQNVTHQFADDDINVNTLPGLGLYLTALNSSLPDSGYGVALNADPTVFPNWGRVFQNIDGGGYVGKNIYTRADLGTASAASPVKVQWTVTRLDTVTNPAGNFSKDLSGNWVLLVGTFVRWKFTIAINGSSQDVATYYLPIGLAEYVSPTAPIVLHQEFFGSATQILSAERTEVRFTDFLASDGTAWYPVEKYKLVYCIDDQAGNLDQHFGWRADGIAMISSSGWPTDPAQDTRTLGATFTIMVGKVCAVTIAPPKIHLSAQAQTATVNVTPQGSCFWGVEAADPWASVTPSGQFGAGTVQVQVPANGYPVARSTILSIGNQSATLTQAGGAPGTPVAALPQDFQDGVLAPEVYWDTRVMPAPAGTPVAQAMSFLGTQSATNGSVTSTGPMFAGSGGFPFAMLDTARQVVILHPCAGNCASPQGAVFTFCAPLSLSYRLQGAFGRANTAEGAGAGVQVTLFQNNNLASPLFLANIGPDNPVDPTNYFAGPGSAAFDLTASLAQGDCVRTGVFAKPDAGDGTFDATAVKLTVTPQAPVGGMAVTSVNTAYGGPAFAQNAWIEVKGANLVPAETPAAGMFWSSAPEFAQGEMPTQIGGVGVTVNSKPAYVWFYCSAQTDLACATDQINVLTPLDSTTGSVAVSVTNQGAVSAPVTVTMQALSPALLLASGNYALATHADYSLVAPASLFPGASTPAQPGETITLYGVGFGLPSTPLTPGSASQNGVLPQTPVVTIGGAYASVGFAGLVSPGLYQINVTLPAGTPSGDNPVVVSYGGASTPVGKVISVQ